MSVEFGIVPPQEDSGEVCCIRGKFYFRVIVDNVPVRLMAGRFEDQVLEAEISANYDPVLVCTSDRLVLPHCNKEFCFQPKSLAEWQAMKPLLEANLRRLGLMVARRWIESQKESGRPSALKDLNRLDCTEPEIRVLFELQREPHFTSERRTIDGFAWFTCLAQIPVSPITVTSADGKLTMSCGINIHASNSRIRFTQFGKIYLPGLGKDFTSEQAEDLFRKMAMKLLEQEKPQGVKTWSLVPVTSLQLQ